MDVYQRLPIHFAAACETTEPLRVLLDWGASLASVDRDKMTPLMYAAMAGWADNIDMICWQLNDEVWEI